MCKREPGGTEALYFLRRVLSNRLCGKIIEKFDAVPISEPIGSIEPPVQAGVVRFAAPARIFTADLLD